MNSDEGSCREVALQGGEEEEGEERDGQLLGIDIGFSSLTNSLVVGVNA